MFLVSFGEFRMHMCLRLGVRERPMGLCAKPLLIRKGHEMLAVPPETEALTRRLAEHKGKTPEQVLKEAVETEARLAGMAVKDHTKPAKVIDMVRVREITRRVVSRPLIDPRAPKDILDEVWDVRG
jgi:antitoxin VapB